MSTRVCVVVLIIVGFKFIPRISSLNAFFPETGVRSEPESLLRQLPRRLRRHPAERLVQEADVERASWQRLLGACPTPNIGSLETRAGRELFHTPEYFTVPLHFFLKFESTQQKKNDEYFRNVRWIFLS